ncbi:MAG: rRNA maturation RNase YbeY [Burkholderiaceae bacterium]|nr:rRNA maturation RNase YbeY [Burkholderiaceae bacterium]MCD8516623.1 rRNA maturation RNase YbeY [Burkholderiaceae bacterium]MCD8538028.1 rRNA maturation RNase YbeY [Burkholderiaceae bacterium]
MTKTQHKTPDLSLAVQYGMQDKDLPRWRIRRWVLAALTAAQTEGLSQVSLTIRFVDKTEGRTLNRQYRQKDYATNVLTFHYDEFAEQTGHIMGDIVICIPVLKQEARAQGKTYLHHAAHLVVHGTLHALGYDHIQEAEAREMESLEAEILERWGIANPYMA